MSNLFDYLDWRGDLSFATDPLTPVDGLILSMLAYLNFTGILPADTDQTPLALKEAAEIFAPLPRVENSEFEANHTALLRHLGRTKRFGDLLLLAARKEQSRAHGIQFGAISVLLPSEQIFLAFEGTDNSLVGWKEDFRMSYECPVPAQLRAGAYAAELAAAYPHHRILLGGHSKGGNLAMFAGVNLPPPDRNRVEGIFNNDGPGFCDNTTASPAYLSLRGRMHTFLPEASLVAALLQHDPDPHIVKSTARGLAQHDGYSWQVLGDDFVYAASRTAFSQRAEAILDSYLEQTPPEKKREFVESLFYLLEASGQDTLSGLGNRKSLGNMLRAYTALSPEMREPLHRTLLDLNGLRRELKKERETK